MRISNINKINNFGIFKGFDWNKCLSYADNKGDHHIYNFKDINIFYGRNYSGKTSLSKIIRGLETKKISDKYDAHSFEIKLEDESIISHSNLTDFNYPIHVYNSDFVKENLKFIHDDSQDIESFSVTLGDTNQQVLDKVRQLKQELGSDKVDEETGIYLAIKNKKSELHDADKNFKDKEGDLNRLLSTKATSGQDSIKYQSNKFGDQNYNITKLKNIDIPIVIKDDYIALNKDDKTNYEQLILEKSKSNPDEIKGININFSGMVTAVKEILTSQVGEASKIDELMQNPNLNRWVENGLNLHQERSTCAFCENPIKVERLDALRQHFDEESKKLKDRITKETKILEASKNNLKFGLDLNQYYEKFHEKISENQQKINDLLVKQVKLIDDLIGSLEEKENNLFESIDFLEPENYLYEIDILIKELRSIREKHIALSSNLNTEQNEARNKLRLDHVYHFVKEIEYIKKVDEIKILEDKIQPIKDSLGEIEGFRDQKIREITLEEDKLSSEGEACIRINEILNHEFGHPSLKLEAKIMDDHHRKSIIFEVQRNGKKAHNLSEGECSLISFCYFLAKIQDDLEEGKEPIIWIDDPISSLDSNHVFFIYSLINQKICVGKRYKQLFISTHSLEFLKYLRRIEGVESDRNIASIGEARRKASYYLIQRDDTSSTIKKMPLYLSKFVTEFNYLFEQIYQCATITDINDSNYTVFYNFGNNARKFLEIYTFYKFPSVSSSSDTLLREFWGDDIYYIMTDRIHNEYSHMCGVFERGEFLTEQPEMQKSARAIVSKVREDLKQYEALLESIGIDKSQDQLYPLES